MDLSGGAKKKRAPKKTGTKKTGTKRVTAIMKPVAISDDLCAFLKEKKGCKLARTDVTRRIWGYIKRHGLQDPKARRNIKPDAALKKLLKSPDVFDMMKLQGLLKKHYK